MTERRTCWGVQYWCAICRSTAARACAGEPPGVRNLPIASSTTTVTCQAWHQCQSWSGTCRLQGLGPTLDRSQEPADCMKTPPLSFAVRALMKSHQLVKSEQSISARQAATPFHQLNFHWTPQCIKFQAHRSQTQLTAGALKWPAWRRYAASSAGLLLGSTAVTSPLCSENTPRKAACCCDSAWRSADASGGPSASKRCCSSRNCACSCVWKYDQSTTEIASQNRQRRRVGRPQRQQQVLLNQELSLQRVMQE